VSEPEWIRLRYEGVFPGLKAQVTQVGGRIRVVGLQLQRQDGITREDLRFADPQGIEAAFYAVALEAIAEQEAVEGATAEILLDEIIEKLTKRLSASDGELRLHEFKAPTKRELRLTIPKARRYPDAFYEKVAALYVLLVAAGVRPAPALADANNVPDTTVHRWIKEARTRGILPPARKAGATG
jgi:hypothetical protein